MYTYRGFEREGTYNSPDYRGYFFFFFARRRADRTDRFFLPSPPLPSPPDFCDAREFETSPSTNENIFTFTDFRSFFSNPRGIFKIPDDFSFLLSSLFFFRLFRAGTKKKMLDTRMTDRIHLLSFDVRFILNTTLYPFERRVNDKKRKKTKVSSLKRTRSPSSR